MSDYHSRIRQLSTSNHNKVYKFLILILFLILIPQFPEIKSLFGKDGSLRKIDLFERIFEKI